MRYEAGIKNMMCAIGAFMFALGDFAITIFSKFNFFSLILMLTVRRDSSIFYSLDDFNCWTDDDLDKYIESNGDYKPEYIRLEEVLRSALR